MMDIVIYLSKYYALVNLLTLDIPVRIRNTAVFRGRT
jgi:hypothetical protein